MSRHYLTGLATTLALCILVLLLVNVGWLPSVADEPVMTFVYVAMGFGAMIGGITLSEFLEENGK